ncbi:hypothetical protein N9811_04335 [Bacteroidia bacterium]|nr:hypothetical protein [Bacteroidia bacterium]
MKSLKKNPDYHLELTYDSDVALETYLAAHSAIRSYLFTPRRNEQEILRQTLQ